jgi:hypothetical protein
MPDDYDDRLRRHEEIMGGLYAMLVEIRERNQRLDATIERLDGAIIELREANRTQRVFNADVKTTLAGIERLLRQLLPPGENGRERA